MYREFPKFRRFHQFREMQNFANSRNGRAILHKKYEKEDYGILTFREMRNFADFETISPEKYLSQNFAIHFVELLTSCRLRSPLLFLGYFCK